MGALHLAICGGGIIAALGLYGFIQEKIMATPYVTEEGLEEFFTMSVFLVFINRCVAMCVGLIGMMFETKKKDAVEPEFYKYCAISISNILATTCQYEALKYVSFPTQTLGKSMKMVPTMLMGKLVSGKKYDWTNWFVSVMVTGGCVMFLLMGDITSKKAKKGGNDSMYGLALMGAYLFFDSFAPTVQEKILGGKKNTASRYRAMFFTNLSSALMSILYLKSSGILDTALAFVARHPRTLTDAVTLSGAASAGQFAIYATVAEYGALTLAAVMNVRQLVQVIVSMVAYKHVPTAGQVGGLSMVFGALIYKSYVASMKAKTAPKDKKTK